jgi:hypothetical protein
MPARPGSSLELDPGEPDRAFGLCDIRFDCPDRGYVSITELGGVRGRLGLPVERDLYLTANRQSGRKRRDTRKSRYGTVTGDQGAV